MRDVRPARVMGVFAAALLLAPFTTVQGDGWSANPWTTGFIFSGAPDEAVSLDVRLSCKADPQADQDPPPFGASLDVLVFEPGTPTPALDPQTLTIDGAQGRARVDIPLTGFAGPAVVTFDDVDLRGPCALSIGGRQYDATTGRTRAAIRPLGDRLVVEPAEDKGTKWVGGGDAFQNEVNDLVVPIVCNAGTAPGVGMASLRVVASEPSGSVAPLVFDVELGGDAAVPLPDGRTLLVREVSVPSASFCPSDGRCVVELSIRDVETTGGCRLLAPQVRLSDQDTGRTVALVYQSYALYPHSGGAAN